MIISRRRILAFFLLSYALSWFGLLGNAIWPAGFWPLPMNPLGPLLAAPIVIALTEGRPGLVGWLRRIARFRAPAWVYLVAFVVPLIIIVAASSLARAIGTPAGPLPALTPVEFLILIPVVLVLGPATEEPAFRGYGQHALEETMTPLAAGLWIGLGVLVWHAPLIVLGEIPLPLIPTLVAVSVVYAWLYAVGRSVWPLVTLHFVQNYFGGEYFGTVFAPQDQWVWTSFLAAFYLAWATGLALRYGPMLGRGAAAVAAITLRTP